LAPDSENAARASKASPTALPRGKGGPRPAAALTATQEGGKGWHRLATAIDMCKGVSAARAGRESRRRLCRAVMMEVRSAAAPDGHNPWGRISGADGEWQVVRYCNGGAPHQAC